MIGSVAEEQRLLPPEPENAQFATVAEVHADGLVLQFDGEDAPRTGKRYRVNTCCTFAAGQRVFVVRASGSYIVVCPVGNPQV